MHYSLSNILKNIAVNSNSVLQSGIITINGYAIVVDGYVLTKE